MTALTPISTAIETATRKRRGVNHDRTPANDALTIPGMSAARAVRKECNRHGAAAIRTAVRHGSIRKPVKTVRRRPRQVASGVADDRGRNRQYESELITSPLALVPSCHHVLIEIELLMNWTWPSAIATLQPPGWLLVAGVMFPWSAETTSHTWQPFRHEAHGYCVEFGGTIVLNIVIVSIPQDHNQPRLVLRPAPGVVVEVPPTAVAKFALQSFSHAPMTGPGAVPALVSVCSTS